MPERNTDATASEPNDRTPASADPTHAPRSTPPEPTQGPVAEQDDAALGPTEPALGTSEPATPQSEMPEYKGEPLDAERGPGLGCFWIQIALLTFFLVFTPLTVTWGWDPLISGALLIFTLILLLFSGQTIIFLLRLVAADRRARRTPLSPSAKPTVGQMEDAGGATVQPDGAAPPDGSDQQGSGGKDQKGDE